MEDVLAVYHRPYDAQRPVVCLDETFRQLVGEVCGPLPIRPGAGERYDSVYVRNGVASVFLAFEPLAGWRQVAVRDTRKREDWAQFVRHLLDEQYLNAERVVLVMDQLNTHSLAVSTRRSHPRRPGVWPIAWRCTTHPNTAPG